jgi:RND family efflux transporter MFP subunit
MTRRRSPAAHLVVLFSVVLVNPLLAGPEHDHDGETAIQTTADSPRRLPDGSVLLPKASQRRLGVRTLAAQVAQLPQSVELVGRVVTDPNAGGKVQPTQAGRIEPGPQGLPSLGQAVSRGQVLAYVEVSISSIEHANQHIQEAELKAQLKLARQRLVRLEQLEGTVAQRDLDAARTEVSSLGARLAALREGIHWREALAAPISGVIAATRVVAGQLVEARELVFEVIDPERLRIEALAYDPGLPARIEQASASAERGESFALDFVGAGRVLREQAVPVHFRLRAGTAAQLSVGLPVKVIAQTRERIAGVPVPLAAVVKNPSNQDIAWVHTSAERFTPRAIRYSALDGATVAITEGLNPGDRVVVRAAPLVNQVR